MVLEHLASHRFKQTKKEPYLSFIPNTTITLKQTMDLNVNHTLRLDQKFLTLVPKAQSMEGKINELNLIKTQTFLYARFF